MGEALGLFIDDIEEMFAHIVRHLRVPHNRAHKTFDRCHRRAQLVRNGGDKIGFHLIDFAFFGYIVKNRDEAVLALNQLRYARARHGQGARDRVAHMQIAFREVFSHFDFSLPCRTEVLVHQ